MGKVGLTRGHWKAAGEHSQETSTGRVFPGLAEVWEGIHKVLRMPDSVPLWAWISILFLLIDYVVFDKIFSSPIHLPYWILWTWNEVISMKFLAWGRVYSKCSINKWKLLLFLEEVVISRSLRPLREQRERTFRARGTKSMNTSQ